MRDLIHNIDTTYRLNELKRETSPSSKTTILVHANSINKEIFIQ